MFHNGHELKNSVTLFENAHKHVLLSVRELAHAVFYLLDVAVAAVEVAAAYGKGRVAEVEQVARPRRVNGYGTEAENLDEPDEDYEKRKEADSEIERRLREGESYRTIQRELGVTPRDIAKVSKKIRDTE